MNLFDLIDDVLEAKEVEAAEVEAEDYIEGR